eukprot:1156119-Pelagomonas_calceolata.AAC.8
MPNPLNSAGRPSEGPSLSGSTPGVAADGSSFTQAKPKKGVLGSFTKMLARAGSGKGAGEGGGDHSS